MGYVCQLDGFGSCCEWDVVCVGILKDLFNFSSRLVCWSIGYTVVTFTIEGAWAVYVVIWVVCIFQVSRERVLYAIHD